MGMMTTRNISNQVHHVLKKQAKQHNRSAEAEVRTIPEAITWPESHLKMGDALAVLGHKIGLTNEDFAAFEQINSKALVEPMRFE